MSTPSEHYEKADAIMARVDEMKNAALPISVALTAQAQVHALLAQCAPDDDWYDNRTNTGYREPYPYRALETRRTTGDRL